jgi:hypothetical protein
VGWSRVDKNAILHHSIELIKSLLEQLRVEDANSQHKVFVFVFCLFLFLSFELMKSLFELLRVEDTDTQDANSRNQGFPLFYFFFPAHLNPHTFDLRVFLAFFFVVFVFPCACVGMLTIFVGNT